MRLPWVQRRLEGEYRNKKLDLKWFRQWEDVPREDSQLHVYVSYPSPEPFGFTMTGISREMQTRMMTDEEWKKWRRDMEASRREVLKSLKEAEATLGSATVHRISQELGDPYYMPFTSVPAGEPTSQ